MVTKLDFNMSDVKETATVPEDIYRVICVSTEIKETQKGGQMVVLKHRIVDDKATGFSLTEYLNIVNADGSPNLIGRAQLKNRCVAFGRPDTNDLAELHQLEAMAQVTIQKGSDDYPDDQNRVKKMHPIDGFNAEAESSARTPKKVKKF